MKFEWDENKNRENKAKHNVSFEEASTIFEDINIIISDDFNHSTYDEERFIMQTVEYDPLVDESLDFTKMKWKHPDFKMINQERVKNLLDAFMENAMITKDELKKEVDLVLSWHLNFKEAMINAILEEFILIKLHKKLLTGENSWLTVAIGLLTVIWDLSKLHNNQNMRVNQRFLRKFC